MDVQLLKGALRMNIQRRTFLRFHNRPLSFLESIHDGLKGDTACQILTCLHIASSGSSNSSSSCSSSSITSSSPSTDVSQEQAALRKASLL